MTAVLPYMEKELLKLHTSFLPCVYMWSLNVSGAQKLGFLTYLKVEPKALNLDLLWFLNVT